MTQTRKNDSIIVPLLPCYGIALRMRADAIAFFESYSQRIADDFAAQFIEVWNRLSPSVQSDLLSYWRTSSYDAVQIEITESGFNGQFGYCSREGFTLRFNPKCLMNEGMRLLSSIAHEIAHAWRYAIGVASETEANEKSERETIAVAESWGFPQTPYDPEMWRNGGAS